jgi:Tol biopolymer transport system component
MCSRRLSPSRRTTRIAWIDSYTHLYTVDVASGRQSRVASGRPFVGVAWLDRETLLVAEFAGDAGVLCTYDLRGARRRFDTPAGTLGWPRVDPARRRLMLVRDRGRRSGQLLTMELASGRVTGLPGRFDPEGASWSPDGRAIAIVEQNPRRPLAIVTRTAMRRVGVHADPYSFGCGP